MNGNGAKAVRVGFGRCALAWMLLAAAARAETVAIEGRAAEAVEAQTGDVVTPATARQDGYPEAVGTPAFWLDASDAGNWTRMGDDVTFIPSKTASAAALKCRPDVEKGLPPVFVSDEAEIAAGGGTALDFGKTGSKRGLWFVDAANGDTPVALSRIGTVAAVYGSQNGGGWLLGGGGSGYDFHRMLDAKNPLDPNADGAHFATPLFHWAVAQDFREGKVLEEGRWGSPLYMGFSGAWQPIVVVGKAAVAAAQGMGVGDTRPGYLTRSGGMKIAEMLVFDRTLTDEEALKVYAYLARKWFGRRTDGVTVREVSVLKDKALTSGVPGTGVRYTVDVPAGETLEVKTLLGGRRDGAFTKTGGGMLALGSASGYAGDVTLAGGTVELGGRAEDEGGLPARGMLVHLDASALNSLETTVADDGTEYVDVWHDLAKFGYHGVNDLRAVAPAATNRPALVRNGLNGRPYVDFGKSVRWVTDQGAEAFEGCYLNFNVAFGGVASAFWVVGAQEGGGNLLGAAPFIRPGNSGYGWDWKHAIFDTGGSFNGLNVGATAQLYVDGRRVPVTSPFPAADWCCVGYLPPYMKPYDDAYAPGDETRTRTISLCGRLFANGTRGAKGGQRLAEMVLYNRVLTEDEIAAVHRHLRRKWFAAGEDVFRHDVAPDLKRVVAGADAATTLRVKRDAVIGALAGTGTLVKEGAGALRIDDVDAFGGALGIREGQVELAARDVPDALTPAAAPCLRIDSSEAESYEFIPGTMDGTNYLACVRDLSGHGNAFMPSERHNAGVAPFLNADADARLNGRPVFDFGPAGSGRWLAFRDAVDTVRAAYVVIGSQAGGGFLLGSSGGNNYDFHRHDPSSNDDPLDVKVKNMSNPSNYVFMLWNRHVVNNDQNPGDTFIDGKKVTWQTGLNGGYQLVEVHTPFAAHASAFACDRGWYAYRSGGQRLAEVVLYDRVLNERERMATRNYLMGKWFNRAPQPLPEEEGDAPYVRAVELADGAGFKAIRAVEVERLAGSGAVTVAGPLSVTDLGGLAGTVRVASGTLALSPAAGTAGEAELVTDGLVWQADATWGVETNGAGQVTRWKNRADGGATSLTPFSSSAGVTFDPMGFHRRPKVDLVGAGLAFTSAAGETRMHLTAIRTVFWMMPRHETGAYLMGGGTNAFNTGHYNFHPGGDQNGEFTEDTPLIHANAGVSDKAVREADWRKNGVPVDPLTEPYAQKMLLSMRVASPEAYTDAEGFAFDGRGYRFGGLSLCEALVYDRALTDEEVLKVERYLNEKWGLAVYRRTETLPALDLAADATLDLGGGTWAFPSLTGAGDAKNGTLVVSKIGGDALRAVSCRVRFSEALDVVPGSDLAEGVFPLLTAAGGIENPDVLERVKIAGLPPGLVARLVVQDGAIVALRVLRGGTVLLLR